MTYKDLLTELEDMATDQLDLDIMIYIDEEFFPVRALSVQEKDGRLRDGHPFIEVV